MSALLVFIFYSLYLGQQWLDCQIQACSAGSLLEGPVLLSRFPHFFSQAESLRFSTCPRNVSLLCHLQAPAGLLDGCSIQREVRDQEPCSPACWWTMVGKLHPQWQEEGGSHLGFHSQLEGPTFEGQHGATMIASSLREDQDTELQEGEDIEMKGSRVAIQNRCTGILSWD